jgi:transcriptional regulator with XRE-family HTH domain
MGDFSVLAVRIKELRKIMKMTQKEFSAFVGCTAATLSAYENGSKSPSLEIIKGIAEECHISIDWLCGLSDKMKNSNEPETYADIIDLLVKIEKSIYFRVGKEKITVSDSVLQYFLENWGKMLPLLHNGTIDDKLYKLWLDDKKKEYENVHLGNEDDIEEFLTLMEVIGSPIISTKRTLEPPQE